MLLGKRPRAPMKRTTSMSEITFDLNTATEVDPNNNPSNQQRPTAGKVGSDRGPWSNSKQVAGAGAGAGAPAGGGGVGGGGGFNFNGLDQSMSRGVLAMVSPRNQRSHSLDLVETPEFLRSCFLCKRRLVPGRDIYMYRGDSAFCSLECRQQQMNQDERKEKYSVASKKQVVAPPNNSGSQVTTTKGETTVAAL